MIQITLIKHDMVLSQLCLILALGVPGLLPAQEITTESNDPVRTDLCGSETASGDKTSPSKEFEASELDKACEQLQQYGTANDLSSVASKALPIHIASPILI